MKILENHGLVDENGRLLFMDGSESSGYCCCYCFIGPSLVFWLGLVAHLGTEYDAVRFASISSISGLGSSCEGRAGSIQSISNSQATLQVKEYVMGRSPNHEQRSWSSSSSSSSICSTQLERFARLLFRNAVSYCRNRRRQPATFDQDVVPIWTGVQIQTGYEVAQALLLERASRLCNWAMSGGSMGSRLLDRSSSRSLARRHKAGGSWVSPFPRKLSVSSAGNPSSTLQTSQSGDRKVFHVCTHSAAALWW